MKKKQEESQLLVRFPSDLFEDAKHFAESHERSLNGEIVWALRQYVEQQKKEEEKARMIETIEQIKPLEAWKEQIEKGEAIFHATLPYERIDKVKGRYLHTYDNSTILRDEGVTFPSYFDTFEELVVSCDKRDLWSNEPTTEAFINRMKHTFEALEEYVIEPDMDEEDIEAIPEDIRLTREDLETIKKRGEEYFADIRKNGMKKRNKNNPVFKCAYCSETDVSKRAKTRWKYEDGDCCEQCLAYKTTAAELTQHQARPRES